MFILTNTFFFVYREDVAMIVKQKNALYAKKKAHQGDKWYDDSHSETYDTRTIISTNHLKIIKPYLVGNMSSPYQDHKIKDT